METFELDLGGYFSRVTTLDYILRKPIVIIYRLGVGGTLLQTVS